MKKTILLALSLVFLIPSICFAESVKIGGVIGPGITYDGNGSDSGTVPATLHYRVGGTVTVSANTGTLAKTGYTFSKWNTAADGSGTDYDPADTFTISGDVTLYAKWGYEYAADFLTGGVATASRIYGEGYEASTAFDDNAATYWDGYPASYPEWLKYNLNGIKKIASQYTIQTAGIAYPTAWQFQGSNNDSDWTALDTQTGQVFTTAEKRTFKSFSNATAYEFYRFYITAASSDEPTVAEMEAMETVVGAIAYGDDIATGGTASASQIYDENYPASKAFDDNTSTYWDGYPSSYPGAWIKYDLGVGVSKTAAQYTIKVASTVYPIAWEFQGSNDDSSWTAIDSRSGQTFTYAQKRTFNAFSNSTGYRYYRWYWIDYSSTEPSISELEIMELQ